MPPSPPLCKFPMPRRRAAALPRIAFPCIVLTPSERLFNDFLLITVCCTDIVDFFA